MNQLSYKRKGGRKEGKEVIAELKGHWKDDMGKRKVKIFADLKDDPGALSLANQFLRKHSEMSNESVYWHVHELSRTPGE